MLSQKQIKLFQKEILEWYGIHQRDLPWRKSRDPYSILVSEVMLQQTQVGRVIPKFEEWMKRFPTLQDLSNAPKADVLRYWSGLGYNRRALFLKKLAEEIMKNLNAIFPQDKEELKKLPGIGEYTAKALLCFAFDKQVAVIDTNIKKVIAVKFFEGIVPEKKILEEVVEELLPQGKAYEWNQALMDYASVMLREHKIPIPKQSKFKDSSRYFRGSTLKVLLKEGVVELNGLLEYFALKNTPIAKERLQTILEGMERDSLLQRKGKKIVLQ